MTCKGLAISADVPCKHNPHQLIYRVTSVSSYQGSLRNPLFPGEGTRDEALPERLRESPGRVTKIYGKSPKFKKARKGNEPKFNEDGSTQLKFEIDYNQTNKVPCFTTSNKEN